VEVEVEEEEEEEGRRMVLWLIGRLFECWLCVCKDGRGVRTGVVVAIFTLLRSL